MADLSFLSFSGTVRPTAFGQYDSDPIFQADADKIVYFVQRNLGTPVLDSELDLRQIFTAFEQATLEYSSHINSHHARNVLLDLLGSSTGSLSGSENIYTENNSMNFTRKVTIQYSSEIGAGGNLHVFTGSVLLSASQQKYDLWPLVSGAVSGTNGKTVTIRRVHHYESVAAYRFFDTTSVMNFLGNQFKFESYSPETIFYLLPIWEDVLRGNQLQYNQRIRRSNYSFDINDYELTVYPVPTKSTNLYFEYTVSKDPTTDYASGSSGRGSHVSKGVVSNISNVAFGHLGYKDINSIGKNWIWRMTLAFCKEVLGQIRSKYGSIPIPGSEITLNGDSLISQGKEEQANLRLELKELLDQMSYKNLMAERNELEETAERNLTRVPVLIYISK